MKKLYFHNYVCFAVSFLLLFFSSRHTSFANENLPKETLPISRPKPVFKAPFKPLPFKTLLPNVELYEFNPKAYAFDKIVGLQPILVGKDWQTVTNDPIKFTLTPSKPTAMLGEEIELTLTAELLDISPRLLFTLEELRNYSIKVILPQDFIQTGGTYLNFATGTLDPANPKHTYTIKGRYLDKPALDDCFKVLRKLNDDVFVLKNTVCINVTDVDVVSIAPETIKEVREVTTGIDVSKVKFLTELKWHEGLLNKFGDVEYGAYDLLGRDGYKVSLDFYIEGWDEVLNKGGSLNWSFDVDGVIHENLCESNTISHVFFVNKSQVFKCTLKIYNGLNCNANTLLSTKTQTITLSRSNNPSNYLSITANETSLCPGASTTLTASTNCPTTSISWQKDGLAYGSNGATTSVSTSGTYKAVCNSPAMVSNTVTINVSNTPTVPNINTNRHSITPGEFATLTASNCQGTVVWQGPNNFTDTGNEISVGMQGNYQALCRSNCNGTLYYSALSAPIGISLLPLRLEADKYEKYSNETAQISAYGCANGFISWKLNGGALPQSDNPLTAYTAGTYSAQCTSFNGPSSDWVSLYISEKSSNSPRITASKTKAYPSDNITLSASGCPSGWFYAWQIPIHHPETNAVTVERWVGSTQNVTGPETYKVQCVLNESEGPFESISISPLSIYEIDITITPNKTEVNPGETVIFTATGNCPNGAGIRWFINGMNYWTWVGQTFQAAGPGTYSARCESGYQQSKTVYYTIKTPKPGSVSIIADKTRAKDNELVTLRAIGCDKEVIWTLPNSSQRAGTSVLFNYGPGVYKASCVRFGFTSEPASITIAERNWNEPYIVNTNGSISSNEVMVLTIEGCPNNWVGWRQPYTDPNTGASYEQISSQRSLVINQPGVYKYHCAVGDYTAYQEIVVQPAAPGSLVIKADKSVARVDEPIVLTAYGCPNGVIEWLPAPPTTKPDGSPNPIVGNRATYYTPGLRQARCKGDISNNGDWAMAYTKMEGTVAPILTADKTEACPTEQVTITLTGCPNGWYYQTQWVNPGMLDYWMTHRQDIDDLGNGYFDVFSFGGGTLNKQGPNMYFGRCISPDGGWMGDFREKYITIEPAFPTDLRATNNGPAMVGDPSVRLAVTEVPNASYTWIGPNTFSSGLRNPEITTLTAAKSGIYTVTLNRGAGLSWGCSVTATTNVKIAENTFIIKSKNAITNEETNVLPTSTNPAVPYGSLALSVENIDSSPMVDYTYSWTSAFQTLSEPTQPFVVINNPGIYQVTIGRVGNPNWSQKLSISITTNNTRTESWTQMREANFINGTPVKIVPLKYSGQDLVIIDNNNKVSPPASEIALATTDVYKSKTSLLIYTQNNVVKKDIMIVTPDFDYARTHTSWGNDFTGKVTFRSLDEKTFLAGWRYQNGNVIGRINEFIANYNVADDDCYDVKFIKQVTVGGDGKSLSDRGYVNTNVVEIIDGQSYGRWEKKVPCSASGNPPLILTGGDPNNVNWAAVNFPREIILGGGVSVPRPPNEKFGLMLTEFFSQVFRNEQIHLHRPDDIISNKADARKFTLLVKLIIASIKKEYPCISGMPTDIVIRDANTLFANGKVQEAGALLATGMGVGCSEAQLQELTAKIPEMMGNIKSTFLTLSKFLEDCTSSAGPPQSARTTNTTPTANPCPGELLVWDILDKLIAKGKNPADVLMSFDGQPYMEETDINNLWADLSAGQPIGTTQITHLLSGAVIKYTPATPTTSASISFKNGASEVVVNSMQELRKQYAQIIGDEISQAIFENNDTWSSTVVDDPMWTLIYEALIETVPDFIPIYGEYLELKRAIEAFDGGNYGQSSFHLSMALVGVIGVDKVKDIARVANSMRRAFKVWKLVKKIEALNSSVARGMLGILKNSNSFEHIFRYADGHLPYLNSLISWAGGKENLYYLVNKTLLDTGRFNSLVLNTPKVERIVINGTEVEVKFIKFIKDGLEQIQVSNFYIP